MQDDDDDDNWLVPQESLNDEDDLPAGKLAPWRPDPDCPECDGHGWVRIAVGTINEQVGRCLCHNIRRH